MPASEKGLPRPLFKAKLCCMAYVHVYAEATGQGWASSLTLLTLFTAVLGQFSHPCEFPGMALGLSGLHSRHFYPLSHLLKITFLNCVYMCGVCAHECGCLQRPEKGVRYSGAGLTDGCKLLDPGIGN